MNVPALHDALNCCALAVGEGGSGRASVAMTAWLGAWTIAARAFPPGTGGAAALAAVIDAAAPSRADEPWRPGLWRALDAAARATAGAGEIADAALLDASGFAAQVPCREAMAVILTAIWDASRSGVPA